MSAVIINYELVQEDDAVDTRKEKATILNWFHKYYESIGMTTMSYICETASNNITHNTNKRVH